MKINFNKRNINIVSFFISTVLFLTIISIINVFPSKEYFSYETSIKYNNLFNNGTNIINEIGSSDNIKLNDIYEWKVEIEKINLVGNITEGTDENIIKNNIGHYSKSNILNGVVQLKAYNTGKQSNFFANLKELEIGDKVRYIVNNKETIYSVIGNKIINVSDENKIIESNRNDMLVLMTFVKDLPDSLRCVVCKRN